jgi:hypothetical protein
VPTSGLSILIYLSYAKHLGTGTKAQNRLGQVAVVQRFAHIGVLKVLEEAGVQIGVRYWAFCIWVQRQSN